MTMDLIVLPKKNGRTSRICRDYVIGGLVQLGFHPTKIIKNAIFICRKAEIELFIKRIGFSNPKHLNKVRA